VLEAADGHDALVKALVRSPSLVVTELGLPLLDGFALCEILRRDRATREVPILVLTTETRPDELERAARVGASAVLAKPAPLDVLLAEMRRLIAAGAALRDRSGEARVRAGAQLERSRELLRRLPRPQPRAMRPGDRGLTTLPPEPALRCPVCDDTLVYEGRAIEVPGVQQLDRREKYRCPRCGAFEYRSRTRTLYRNGS
jgi:CheY-like chemotaxis protein